LRIVHFENLANKEKDGSLAENKCPSTVAYTAEFGPAL
jgi:hypothetical protein